MRASRLKQVLLVERFIGCITLMMGTTFIPVIRQKAGNLSPSAGMMKVLLGEFVMMGLYLFIDCIIQTQENTYIRRIQRNMPWLVVPVGGRKVWHGVRKADCF